MYIQTTLDDQLLQQAAKLSGLADKQALLEEALRLLIQTKKKPPETKGKRYQIIHVQQRVMPSREELYDSARTRTMPNLTRVRTAKKRGANPAIYKIR